MCIIKNFLESLSKSYNKLTNIAVDKLEDTAVNLLARTTFFEIEDVKMLYDLCDKDADKTKKLLNACCQLGIYPSTLVNILRSAKINIQEASDGKE